MPADSGIAVQLGLPATRIFSDFVLDFLSPNIFL
jgi:hypothetical protein